MWNTRVRGLIAVDSLIDVIDNLNEKNLPKKCKIGEVIWKIWNKYKSLSVKSNRTRQQMATVNAQILELEATSQAVSNQPEDLALHQQLGGVLIEYQTERHFLRF